MSLTEYRVTLGIPINFAPSSVVEEVIQNVRTLISITIGECPLDRALGVSTDFLDEPTPVARALYKTAVIDAISRFEPRAKFSDLKFEGSAEDEMEGKLKPVVIITIEE